MLDFDGELPPRYPQGFIARVHVLYPKNTELHARLAAEKDEDQPFIETILQEGAHGLPREELELLLELDCLAELRQRLADAMALIPERNRLFVEWCALVDD